MLCAVVQLGSPMRAYALFEWLDHLSGPGPFQGIEFQFKLFCVMSQPSLNEAIESYTFTQDKYEFAKDKQVDFQAATDTRALSTEVRDLLNPATTDKSQGLLKLAARAQSELGDWRQQVGTRTPNRDELLAMVAWERSEQLLREAAVPRLRKAPGSILWASCRDNPNGAGEPYRLTTGTGAAGQDTVHRRDRHPVFSLNFDYRYYTTGTFFLFGPSTSPDYANDRPIQLQIVELQPSWPLTGRFDILDGQAGLGWYQFTSEGFSKFGGLVVEPVRFDLHFPARLADGNTNLLMRALYSASFHWALTAFPGGFSENPFNATGSANRDISGGEMILEKGIVMNVGRLFGK